MFNPAAAPAGSVKPLVSARLSFGDYISSFLMNKLSGLSFLKIIGSWLIILVFAVINGGLRESFFIPALGNPLALILSALLLSLAIVLVAFIFLSPLNAASSLAIGFFWLLLTLIFEFGFGFIQGKSWAVMLDAYTFKDGNLWPLVLLVVLFSPYLVFSLKNKREQKNKIPENKNKQILRH